MAPKYIDELSSIAFQCAWWTFCCLWNNSLVTIFVVTKFKRLLHFFYVVFPNLQPFRIKMSLLHNLYLLVIWLWTIGVLMSKIISEGLPYIGFTYDNSSPSTLTWQFNSKWLNDNTMWWHYTKKDFLKDFDDQIIFCTLNYGFFY